MKIYAVFRGNDELYGWTHSKDILKIFLKQRNEKYKWKKLEYSSMDELDNRNRINYVNISSVKINKEIKLFITPDELYAIEIYIHNLFSKECSFRNYENSDAVVDIFLLLKEKYLNALKLIGFEPIEVKIRCNEYPCTAEDYVTCISEAYEYIDFISDGKMAFNHYIPGGAYCNDFHRYIYSLETFIMALRDELRR